MLCTHHHNHPMQWALLLPRLEQSQVHQATLLQSPHWLWARAPPFCSLRLLGSEVGMIIVLPLKGCWKTKEMATETSVPLMSLGWWSLSVGQLLLLDDSLSSFLLSLYCSFWVHRSLSPSLRFSWYPLDGGNWPAPRSPCAGPFNQSTSPSIFCTYGASTCDAFCKMGSAVKQS